MAIDSITGGILSVGGGAAYAAKGVAGLAGLAAGAGGANYISRTSNKDGWGKKAPSVHMRDFFYNASSWVVAGLSGFTRFNTIGNIAQSNIMSMYLTSINDMALDRSKYSLQ